MDYLVHALKKLIPDQIGIFIRRYQILKAVEKLQPTGRRSVAQHIGISERTVRTEIDKLNDEGLIAIGKSGMFLTDQGIGILNITADAVREFLGFTVLEQQMVALLSVKKVLIVAGNSDETAAVKNEIGTVAAQEMMKNVHSESVISLTGGSTMTCLVNSIPDFNSRKARLVVPARGSVGHKVEQQSDMLSSRLAGKLKAEYRLLNIPDSLSIKAMNEIRNEPNVQEVLLEMQQADVLAFGIGDALEMAEKRKVSETIFDFLKRKEAIAEAFGYYFNSEGTMVYSSRSISLGIEEIKKIGYIIAVAGGKSKAQSIIAISRILKNMILVIDEGAALEILKRLS